MTKIVYNSCFGGFGLSARAQAEYLKRTGKESQYHRDIGRTDPVLVAIVEEMGEAANNDYSRLAIRELPAGTHYRIDEYDGNESVMTPDDYVWSVA